jgi:hypothetical protein
MANTTLEPAGSAPPPPKTKPSLVDALRSIFSKSEETDEGKVIARRRKFVMAVVLGTLSVNLLMFLRFFIARAVRAEGQSSASDTRRISASGGYQISESVPHLGGAQYRGVFVISAICTHLGCTPDWKASEANSSARATAAATIPKALTSKVRRRAPWIGRTWNWTPKDRLWWT